MGPSDRSPKVSRPLKIYLQDHYAGATAGVALFRRAASSHTRVEVRAELSEIAKEIAEDRDELREMMRSVRVRMARTKVALAWIAERLGRLKPNGWLFRRSRLSDVVELEGLLMGVRGKATGWQSLLEAAEPGRLLDRSVIEVLVKRADDQLARLERLHREGARSTFG